MAVVMKPRRNDTEDNSFVIRQSSLKSWRKCRKEYHFKYVERIEPKKPKKPLIRGTIIHEMIEAHINGKDPWAVYRNYEKLYGKLFREEQEIYGTLLEDIELIMQNYFLWWERDPIKYLLNKRTGSRAEHDFEVDLGRGIKQKGTIDSVGTSRDGRTWLVEHKSVTSLPTDLYRYSDIQSVTYTQVVPTLGFPKVDGVCWNYIRAKPPTVPDLLKKGELTRSNIDTTWDVYLAAIKRHKLDPDDYKDMQAKLKGAEKKFFLRVYLPVKPVIVSNVMAEVMQTAREMAELHDRPETHVRNITRDCHWCSYGNLCRAELSGLDADFIRKADFKVTKGKDHEVEKKARLQDE